MSPEAAAHLMIVKDVVLMLTAIVAASVGVIGLRTWQRQIAGKSRHDAAANLLAATYRVRNAIQAVRNIEFRHDELPVFQLAVSDQDFSEIEKRKLLSEAYEQRWMRLESAISDFDKARFEAMVALGDGVESLCGQMDNCYYYLSSSAHHYFSWIRDSDLHGAIPEQFRNAIEKQMGLVREGEVDDYSKMLHRVVRNFEGRLIPVIRSAR